MEIVLTWSWFSFVIGIVATLTFLFWLLVMIAVKKYREQQRKATQGWDSVDKLFQSWGGRDNGNSSKP